MRFEGVAQLARDEWLSAVTGIPSWKLSVESVGSRVTNLPELGDTPWFAYAKVDTDCIEQANYLSSLGFYVATTELTFSADLNEGWPLSGCVRKARPEDEDAVAEIAAHAFVHDRFHKDPVLQAQAGRIKKGWAANYFRGTRGDSMIVHVEDGRVRGFVQLLLHGEDLVIDLIAVEGAACRKGIGSSLISSLAKLFPEARRVLVGTQVTNIPSLSLYGRFGFRMIRSNYVLHATADAIAGSRGGQPTGKAE
ncbi:dTDP-fucosamine acetyltransferase [Pseudodesulfovibrio hydrargyri]|uniref:dTDP-fucosamine acetyltransferase n=1 Tax=Pseudodesulfovibrio hydrargyri TaxID=2125990 RepID=A0A1J5NA17_9BACT|nr:GNAT family N-acetyltransferase [Pseudodesulfovibrio hydrargyri]OIQ50063.1 dTDP-fucosamine acetyltransferase [Pseudodesulfovibrio hydrargyri]